MKARDFKIDDSVIVSEFSYMTEVFKNEKAKVIIAESNFIILHFKNFIGKDNYNVWFFENDEDFKNIKKLDKFNKLRKLL